MNEHHETSSNPYEEEAQIPYASWAENKTSDQETQAAPTPPPHPSSVASVASVPPAQWYTSPGPQPQTAAPPRQNGYLQGLATTTIIGSSLLILVGLVGIPLTIINFFNAYFSGSQVDAGNFFSYQALYLTITVICLLGGGLSLYHGIRSVLKRPSVTVHLPPFWVALIPYILILGMFAAIEAAGWEILLVLLVLLFIPLLILLAGTAYTAFSLRSLPISAASITWRRLIVSLVSGATVPFFLVALLYLFVRISLVYAITSCIGANPAPYCSDQLLTTTLMLIAIIGPIVVVTITPLLLAFYIRTVEKAGVALLLGLACGVGLGIMEGVFMEGSEYHNWIGLLLTSLSMIVLNGTSGALVALGWYHILNPDHRHWLKAAGYWLWAVGQQIIFYLLSIVILAVEPVASFVNNWKFSLGTGVVSLYEIGYIVGVIVVVALFVYLIQRLRKEETPLPETTPPSAEVVVPSTEVSSDVSEMGSDV